MLKQHANRYFLIIIFPFYLIYIFATEIFVFVLSIIQLQIYFIICALMKTVHIVINTVINTVYIQYLHNMCTYTRKINLDWQIWIVIKMLLK